MEVCCQNQPLGALSSRSAPSVLVGELFEKFGVFFNTPRNDQQCKLVFMYSTHHPRQILMEPEYSRQIFEKVLKYQIL